MIFFPRLASRLVWLLIPVIALLPGRSAFAWGAEGHRIVAAIAEIRLSSTAARENIAKILGADSMSDIASWPDQVRHLQPADLDHPKTAEEKKLAEDPDTIAFVAKFHTAYDSAHKVTQGSASWHIVDLPLDAKGYDDPALHPPILGSPGMEDIVQKLTQCIAILQDPDIEIHGAFGKRNALRVLVHLTGDIHQPLHLSSNYIDDQAADPAKLFVCDPKLVQERHLGSDRQGNDLYFQYDGRDEELHAFWDEVLVHDVVTGFGPGEGDSRTCAAALAAGVPAKEWDNENPIALWPVQWADDSLPIARRAFEGVTATDVHTRIFTNPVHNTRVPGYPIALPPGYEAAMTPLVQIQLAKAGYRLARLLDRIWPD